LSLDRYYDSWGLKEAKFSATDADSKEENSNNSGSNDGFDDNSDSIAILKILTLAKGD